MRSYILLAALLLYCLLPSRAQWTQQTLTPFGHVYSVHAIDAQNAIATGAPGRIYKTTNGGSPWIESEIPDPLGAAMTFDTLYGAWMLDASTWVVAGYSTFEIQEIIIRTANAGISWDVVSMGPDYTGHFDLEFTSSTEGFAVGKEGRILRTTNAGSSWSLVTSPVTNALLDLDMYDTQTGYIAGSHVILKTTNGGSSWQSVNSDPDRVYQHICAASATELYASGTFNFGNEAGLWRSMDGGNNWIQLTPPFAFRGALYSPAPGTVMFAGTDHLYISYDLGEHWYYYPETEDAHIRTIRFSDAQNGYIAGSNGSIFHTGNGGGTPTPFAFFSNSESTICPDQPELFTNASPLGLAYQWSIDGVPVATSYDAMLTFATLGNHLVTLEVTDNGITGEHSMNVNVLDPPMPQAFGFYFGGQPQHCQGSNVFIHFTGGEQYYQAQVNGVPITPWTYIDDIDFDDLILYDVDSTCVVEVVARRISCDTTYLSHFDTLWVVPLADPATVVTISDTLSCVGDTVTMTIEDSEIGITYVFGTGEFEGNGGPLTSGNYVVSGAQLFTVIGYNSINCDQLLASWTVVGDPLHVHFDPVPLGVYTGGSSVMDNQSVGNGSYWVTGGGAVPATSTLESPTVTFPLPGLDIPITLTETNSAGCSRSVTHPVTVMDPAAPSALTACPGFSILDLNDQVDGVDQIMDMAMDGDGNTIITGWNAYDGGDWYGPGAMIAKYDGSGAQLWSYIAPNQSNIKTSCGVSLAVDLEGNVYMAGFYTNASVAFAGYTLTGVEHGRHAFIIKFSSAGDPQWIITAKAVDDDGMGGIADVLVDVDQSIWFPISHTDNVNVTFADGLVATYDFGYYDEPRFRLFHVSSDGELLTEPILGAIRDEFEGEANYYHPDEFGSSYQSHFVPSTPQLFQTCQGEIGIYTWGAGTDIFHGPYGQQFDPPYGAVIGIIAPNTTYFRNVFSPFRRGDMDNIGEFGERYRAMFLPQVVADEGDIVIAFGSAYGFQYSDDTTFIDLPDATFIHEVGAGMVMRLDPYTGERLWMDQLRGMDVHDLAIGEDHQIHVYGRTRSHFAVQAEGEAPVGLAPISVSEPDVALLTLSPSGHPIAIDGLGGSGDDNAFAMATDLCGQVAMCGYAASQMTGFGEVFAADAYFLVRGSIDGSCDLTMCSSFQMNGCVNAVCEVDDVPISWSFTNMGDAVNVSWHADPDDPLQTIATDVPIAQGSVVWDAPDNLGGSTITVVITDASDQPLDSMEVTFNAPFTFTLEASAALTCMGDSVQVSAPPGFDHYTWSASTAGTDQIMVFAEDTVYCTVEDGGCSTEASLFVPFVPIELGIPSDTTACSGDPLYISAFAGYQSYAWSNGATTSTVLIDSSGTYTVFAVHDGGCTSTDTIEVTLTPSPDPELLADEEECAGAHLNVDPGYIGQVSYLWYNGGQANYTLINAGGPNLYWVTVTGNNGCTGVDSLWITGIICTGVEELTDEAFRLYPDPCVDRVQVEVPAGMEELALYDVQGRLQRIFRSLGHVQAMQLDVADLAPGMYELRITDTQGSIMTARFHRIP